MKPAGLSKSYWDHERVTATRQHFESLAAATLERRDWERLATVAHEWIAWDASASSAWLVLGIAHERQGLLTEAMNAYKVAESLEARYPGEGLVACHTTRWKSDLQARLPKSNDDMPEVRSDPPLNPQYLFLLVAATFLSLSRVAQAVVVAFIALLSLGIAWVAFDMVRLRTVDYYLNHFDARMEKIESCGKLRDPTKDNECMNAYAAQRAFLRGSP